MGLLVLAAAAGLGVFTTGYALHPVPATPETLALAVQDKDVDRLHPGKIVICLKTAYPIGPYTATTARGDGTYATRVVDRQWSAMIAEPRLVDGKLCGIEEVRTNGLGDRMSPQCLALSDISAVMIPTPRTVIDGSVLESWVKPCPGSPSP
jgi:hypothetical protein